MTKTNTTKTTAKTSPERLAKGGASSVQLSDAQLDQVRGGSLNFPKITYNTNT